MYARKIKIGLISLEKDVVKNRSRGGHMVLVSDAAHKFTPSRGAGYNDGIIDSLALANTPNRAFSSSVPSSDRLDAAFKDYRDMRYDAVTASYGISSNNTATATWLNLIMKFLDITYLSLETS